MEVAETLHHAIIINGIERCEVVDDETGRNDFRSSTDADQRFVPDRKPSIFFKLNTGLKF